MTATTAIKTELVRAWLVFLEREYSLDVFRKENKRFGTVRKIPLDILENMMWSDKVCQFYWMAGLKSALWFATWPITKVLGLSKDAVSHIIDNCQSSACDMGGALTIRAYGNYRTGLTYRVELPLKRIASLLRGFQATGGEIGDPMIGCGAGVVKYLGAPFPKFPNIPVDPDLVRPFDYLAAKADISRSVTDRDYLPRYKGRGVAKGCYFFELMSKPDLHFPFNPLPDFPKKNYCEDMEGGVGGGLVQTALNYVSAEARSQRISL